MTSPVVQPSQNGVVFLDHVCKSATLNVSFSVLTKCCALILEDYAILEKRIKYIYINFGVHGPLNVTRQLFLQSVLA